MKYKLWSFQDEDLTKIEDQPQALILWAMGLGKTFGAVERDRRLRVEVNDIHFNKPTLIVAPMSTHEQWKRWLGEVYFEPPTFVFSEDRDYALNRLTKHRPGFYILHWELLRSANPRYWASSKLYPALTNKKFPFLHVIADEVHRAKSRTTQQAKVLKKIPTQYKTGLTGTPITNRPPDLWSILHWLKPKEWSSYWRFYDQYSIWIPQHRGSAVYREYLGPKDVEELQSRIVAYTVQRKKEDVLTDLPDRYYTTIKVDLDPKQRRAYDSMRRNMVAWIGEQEETPIAALATAAKLIRLQQFAIAHAEIILTPHRHNKGCPPNCQKEFDEVVSLREPSSKLDAVMEKLDEMGEEQVVVFSQSKQGIKLLAIRLSGAGISYSIFHGDLSKSTKRSELDKFINGETRVFIATGQSGGEGIDGLQCAATLIRTDRSFSAASEDQEESRLHRSGQKSAVHIVDIVARDTIDQLKDRRIMQKAGWSRAVLEGLQ